jgi:hypothetical protein
MTVGGMDSFFMTSAQFVIVTYVEPLQVNLTKGRKQN